MEKKYSYDENAPINVWVGNLRKYNEGELSGGWVALPVDDVEDVFCELGIDLDRDEYHIPDWECRIPGMKYNEYANLDELNDIAAQVVDMDEYDFARVGIRMDLLGEGFAEALDGIDDVRIWYGCNDMSDVAAEYVDECGLLDSMPENLRYYFDYAALGRDMGIEGTFDYSEELGCMVEVMY